MKTMLLLLAGCFVSTLALAQSGPPTVNATVINSSSNPVPVQGLINVRDAKTPFQRNLQCENSGGGSYNFCNAYFTVDANTQITLQYVGLQCVNGVGTSGTYPTPVSAFIQVNSGSQNVSFGLNTPLTGPLVDRTRYYTFGQPVLIQALPGSFVTFQFVVTESAINVGCTVGLSGYQVPAS